MKTKLFFIAMLAALHSFTTVAQSHSHNHQKESKAIKMDTSLVKDATKAKYKEYYTCTMHPEVISDKPGKCPKCGMTLVKVKPAVNVKKSHKMHKDTSMVKPSKANH